MLIRSRNSCYIWGHVFGFLGAAWKASHLDYWSQSVSQNESAEPCENEESEGQNWGCKQKPFKGSHQVAHFVCKSISTSRRSEASLSGAACPDELDIWVRERAGTQAPVSEKLVLEPGARNPVDARVYAQVYAQTQLKYLPPPGFSFLMRKKKKTTLLSMFWPHHHCSPPIPPQARIALHLPITHSISGSSSISEGFTIPFIRLQNLTKRSHHNSSFQ